MKTKHIVIDLRLPVAMTLLKVITTVVLVGCLDGLKQSVEPIKALTGAGVSTETSLMKCTLQGTPRLPAFSTDGDFVIGGVFAIHYEVRTGTHHYNSKPEVLMCAGRLVRKIDSKEF